MDDVASILWASKSIIASLWSKEAGLASLSAF